MLLAAALVVLAAPVAFADDEKKADDKKPTRGKRAGKVDRAKLFDTMDGDKDGTVSKDEFASGMEKRAERIKERAGDKAGRGARAGDLMEKVAQKAFEKLDANGDGSISKDEFEKSEFDPSNLKSLREKFGKGKTDR